MRGFQVAGAEAHLTRYYLNGGHLLELVGSETTCVKNKLHKGTHFSPSNEVVGKEDRRFGGTPWRLRRLQPVQFSVSGA